MSEQKDNWEQYAITPDKPKEDTSWEQYSVGGKERVKSSNLAGYALMGGAGAGAAGVAKLALDPFIKSMQLNNQAKGIKSALNIPKKTPLSQLPQIVSEKIKQPAGDLAVNIKEQLPKWKQQVYANYGAKINEYEGMLKGSNVSFNTANFNELLSSTASNLESNGFIKEANNIRKQIVPSKGGGLKEFLDFKEALKRVQVLKKQNPSVARTLNSNWGNFLSNDPVMSNFPEIKTGLDKINAEYTTFKDVDNALSSFGKKGGKFKTSGIQRYIEQSLKGGNSDAFRAIDYLSKGSEIVPPMSGIAEKVPLMKGMADFNKIANDLAMKSEALKGPIARRVSLARWGAILGGMGRFGGAMSMYPMASQALGYQADPTQFMAEQYGVGKERQRYQSGQMTEEEKIRLGLTT